jgi:hypothetical protein
MVSGKEDTEMAGQDWTFWLNMTNLALGVVTLLALLLVFGAFMWEIAPKWRRKKVAFEEELRARWQSPSHSLAVPELGLTMADGGEELKPTKQNSSNTELRGK